MWVPVTGGKKVAESVTQEGVLFSFIKPHMGISSLSTLLFSDLEGTPKLVTNCCATNDCQTWQLKTTNGKYVVVSVGQEAGPGVSGSSDS